MAAVGRSQGHFHEGELEVQRHAGVANEASRLSAMLAPAYLQGGVARFLETQTVAVLSARDRVGRRWISPLAGQPGFLEVVGPQQLAVSAAPGADDPLADLPAGQPVGLLVIDFATRRRFRINGMLTAAGDLLRIEADEAYGNCPQHISRRRLVPGSRPPVADLRRGSDLTTADIALIRRADTAFIGTSHPTRGADASHRGGPPGFLRVDGNQLWWPDYAGNNMFNTLGNLAVDPSAALLVPDFTTGAAVQLSGTAATEWDAADAPDDPADVTTGRRVRFTVQLVISGVALPWRSLDRSS